MPRSHVSERGILFGSGFKNYLVNQSIPTFCRRKVSPLLIRFFQVFHIRPKSYTTIIKKPPTARTIGGLKFYNQLQLQSEQDSQGKH